MAVVFGSLVERLDSLSDGYGLSRWTATTIAAPVDQMTIAAAPTLGRIVRPIIVHELTSFRY